MSQADIETLRAAYEAASRRDLDAILRVAHPDVEFKTTLQGTHRGHEEVRRFFEDQWEPFEEVVSEPEEFLQVGDRIVVRLLVRSRPTRGGGAVLEVRNGHVWTMRDGKAARCETFPKPEQAFEAVGLGAETTARENVEAIRSGYDAVNRGDQEAFFQFLDPAIEWKAPDRTPFAGTYHGHEAVREFLDSYLEAFDDLHLEPEEFFDADDRIVVFVRESARGKGSGVEVQIRVGHLWTMREGKAVGFEYFPEREKALDAAGLKESG
jgi:ketosteroid isomerase-like protein